MVGQLSNFFQLSQILDVLSQMHNDKGCKSRIKASEKHRSFSVPHNYLITVPIHTFYLVVFATMQCAAPECAKPIL